MTPAARDDILDTLKGALDRASNGRAQLDQLDDQARLIEDVGLSSLDLLDLRCELEDHWRIKVADEELAEMRTVGDVVHLIQKRSGATTKEV